MVREDHRLNSIKSLFVVTVLAAVSYGVYVSLNQPAPGPPPEGAPVEWGVAPLAEAPAPGGAPVAAVDAPPFMATSSPLAAAPSAAPSTAIPVAAAPPAVDAPQAAPWPQDTATAAAPPAASSSPSAAAPYADAPAYDAQVAPPATDLAAPLAAPTAAPAAEYTSTAAPTAPAASNGLDYAALSNHVQSLLDQGRLTEAQLALSESFHTFDDPTLSVEQRQWLLNTLDQLTGTIVYSQEHLLEQAYVVQSGDTLDRVAAAYNVPWQLLAKINSLDTSRPLTVGQTLKVVRGPFSAFVEAGSQRLTLWINGRYAGRFSISLGQGAPPTEGEFAVLNKVEVPDGADPSGADPLGRYLIDLGDQWAIHAGAPQDTRGCLRLAPQEAEDVYDILTVGSRVYIQR